jgi:hypothetical protein
MTSLKIKRDLFAAANKSHACRNSSPIEDCGKAKGFYWGTGFELSAMALEQKLMLARSDRGD